MKAISKIVSHAAILGLLSAQITGQTAVGGESNLVVNGSFELGTDPGIALQINAVDSSTIPGWTVQSGSIDYYGTAWAAGDGGRSLDMSGISAGAIAQNVSGFSVGSTYRLSFLIAGNPGEIPPLPSAKRLRASVGTVSREFSFSASGHSYSDMGWVEESLDFTATSTSMTLSFVSLTGGAGGAALDRVSIVLTTNSPAPPPPEDLVANGSFEIGLDPGAAQQINAPNSSAISGWSVDSGNIDYYGSAWGAGDGSRSLDLCGLSPGSISQNVSGFSPGFSYRLSFLMAGNPASIPSLPALKRLRATVGPNSQEYSFNAAGHDYFDLGWTLQSLEFTATGSSMLLRFESLTDGAGGAALDKVSISPTTNTVPTNAPPLIVTQPRSVVAFEGSNATFSVVAAGTQPLTYQWRFGAADMAGETNPVLNLVSVGQPQAGRYSVLIANDYGAVTSQVATLTVTNYSSAIFDVSDFSVESNPGAVWSYGWFGSIGGPFQLLTVSGALNVNGIIVNSWRLGSAAQPTIYWNGTTNTLVTAGGQGVYPPGTVWAYTGVDGTPQNFGAVRFTAPVGSAARYKVEASFLPIFSGPISGDTDIHVVKNGVEIFSQFLPSSTGTTYTNALNMVAGDTLDFLVGRGADGREYASGLKISARLVPRSTGTNLPPVILAQPQSRTALEGTNVSFAVFADGTPELTYQWLHNENALPNGTNSVLNLVNVALADAGSYAVLVTNAFGSATSQVATLTVTQPPASLRVVGGNAAGGGTVSVPVQIRANGNENAIGFSLNFNATLLTFSDAAIGSGAPAGAALILNTNEAASGRLGLGIGLPANGAFAHGTQEVAVVTFLVAPVINQTTTAISFGDVPTLRQLADKNAQSLPATYSQGNLTIADSQVEGDVAPRPEGNRTVSITDWAQMGRFVALLDTIDGTNEFQRADCAPRATKGNGAIGVSDWVQAGRYAIGLDPLTIAAGPTKPEGGGGGGFIPASTGTKLSVLNSSIAQGQTNTLPVVIESQGDANAMSFSVTFEPTKLAFVTAATGSAASGAALNLNLSQVPAGRIGFALALPPGSSFAAGPREVLQLRFAALAIAPASAAVGFGNEPVAREVSDAQANTLSTIYVPGTVSVTPPPGPPLQVTRSGNLLLVTWPSSAAGFDLEVTAGALGTTWSSVPGVVNLGEQKLAIVTMTEGQRYFRLKKP